MSLNPHGRTDSCRCSLARKLAIPARERHVLPIAMSRRNMMSLLAATVAAGCNAPSSSNPSEVTPAQPRLDVPLRVLMIGSAADAESIRLAWSMTMQQPLVIETIAPANTGSATNDLDPAIEFATRMKSADIAILPNSFIGEISRISAAVTLNPSLQNEFDAQYGKRFPAVEESLGNYGGETWGVPVGAKLLALLSLDPQLECDSWAAYHTWVEELNGSAAEPLADGWAASSFLNRCASTFSRRWMFNRRTLQPEIDSADYVAALEQFAATAKLYKSPPMTPGQIWNALRSGDLAGGIGFEVPETGDAVDSNSANAQDVAQQDVQQTNAEQVIFDVSVFNCPLQVEVDQVWFSPQTPIVCLSRDCRQTDAGKQFIGWLSGGERISSVHQQSNLFSLVRSKLDQDSIQSFGPYQRWLTERLQTRQVVPGLTLPGAQLYHDVLDQQVLRCLNGEQSAQIALAEAAQRWEAITDAMGREQQMVAWKRTLGFGS